MANFNAKYFIFNDINCSAYNLCISSFNNSGVGNNPFQDINMQVIKPFGYNKDYTYNSAKFNNLEFEMDLCSSSQITSADRNIISVWLYGWGNLQILQPDMIESGSIYKYFKCCFKSIKFNTIGNVCYGLTATVVCDSNYCYGQSVTQLNNIGSSEIYISLPCLTTFGIRPIITVSSTSDISSLRLFLNSYGKDRTITFSNIVANVTYSIDCNTLITTKILEGSVDRIPTNNILGSILLQKENYISVLDSTIASIQISYTPMYQVGV